MKAPASCALSWGAIRNPPDGVDRTGIL